jgi:hypothetical protein
MERRILKNIYITNKIPNKTHGNIKSFDVNPADIITVRWPKCMNKYFEPRTIDLHNTISFEEFCLKNHFDTQY